MAVLLALLSSALWGTADFLGGTASRRVSAAVVVGLSQTAALLVVAPLALLLGDRPDQLWAAPVAGLVGVVGLLAFYRALATGTMGVVAPVAALGVVVPVLVGLAEGDRPGALQVAGIVTAVGGVVLASGPELSGDRSLRPLLLALVAAGGFGGVFVLVAQGSEGGPGAVLVTLALMRATSVTVLSVAALALRPALAAVRPVLPLVVATGIFDVSANDLYALASRQGLLSVVGVLSSLYPVVTVLLARRVHAERLVPVQVVGVGAALVGVALIALG